MSLKKITISQKPSLDELRDALGQSVENLNLVTKLTVRETDISTYPEFHFAEEGAPFLTFPKISGREGLLEYIDSQVEESVRKFIDDRISVNSTCETGGSPSISIQV